MVSWKSTATIYGREADLMKDASLKQNMTQVMALNEKSHFPQILVIMTHRALTFPRNIFAVL